MPFRVVTAEPASPSGLAISSAFTTADAALDFACDLLKASVEVTLIKDDSGAIVRDADEVKTWCAAHPRKRVTSRHL